MDKIELMKEAVARKDELTEDEQCVRFGVLCHDIQISDKELWKEYSKSLIGSKVQERCTRDLTTEKLEVYRINTPDWRAHWRWYTDLRALVWESGLGPVVNVIKLVVPKEHVLLYWNDSENAIIDINFVEQAEGHRIAYYKRKY